ncbi:MAG: cytochrome b6-f complex subunit PetL [Cyanobacteriota bacterium ELA615]
MISTAIIYIAFLLAFTAVALGIYLSFRAFKLI